MLRRKKPWPRQQLYIASKPGGGTYIEVRTYQEARAKVIHLLNPAHAHNEILDNQGQPVDVGYLVTIMQTFEARLHYAAIVTITGDLERGRRLNVEIADVIDLNKRYGYTIKVNGSDEEDGRVASLYVTAPCGCFVKRRIDYTGLLLPEVPYQN